MQDFLRFWNKDFINKLILIHTTLLFIGVTALVVFLFRMPEGKTFGGFLGNLFPTPTIEPKVIMTQAAEQAILKSYYATASVPPTITTQPLAELFSTETPIPEGFSLLPTETPIPTATGFQLPTATSAVPEGQPTPTIPAEQPGAVIADSTTMLACLPSGKPEQGRVIDVISGNEIKVLVGEFAYIIRYIGVETPTDAGFAIMSTNQNGTLTFGKDVLLYKDAELTDGSGRSVRWVVLDGKLPAMQLLEKGLLTFTADGVNTSCLQSLKDAELKAKDSRQGIWSIP